MSGTFCYIFLYRPVATGNQHGGREYGDLQNWPDMTSHEKPLLASNGLVQHIIGPTHRCEHTLDLVITRQDEQ